MMSETKFFVKDGDSIVEKSVSIEKATELYKNNLSNTYPASFYRGTTKCKGWQIDIGETIGKMYNIESVVDFGCGLGYYLEGFQKTGSKVKGYEISYENAKQYMSKLMVDFVEQGNVMEQIDCGVYDLAMSIEVAEHILPEKSSVFVDNLSRASNKYVLLTAATPGQGGVCHINERDMSFWIDLMSDRGFCHLESESDNIRIQLNKMPHRGKYYSIVKKHLTLFGRKS